MTNARDAGPHSPEGRPAAGTGAPAGESALPDKPILEWTEEDWALWIAGPPPASPASPDPSSPPPPQEDVPPEPEAPPEGGPEIPGEPDATGQMETRAGLDTGPGEAASAAAETVAGAEPSAHGGTKEPEPAAERPAAEVTGTGPAATDEVADGRDGPSFPTTTEERDGWVPEVEPAVPEPAAEGRFELDGAESDDPRAVAAEVDDLLAAAAEVDEPLSVAAEDAGEPSTVSVDVAGQDAAEVDEPLPPAVAAVDVAGQDAAEADEPLPPTVAAEVAGEAAEVEPVRPDEEPAREAERAQREWWEAVPPPLPPPSPPIEADGRDEAGAGAGAPAATRALRGLAAGAPAGARPPIPPSVPARAVPGRAPAPGAPVTGTRPAPPRAQPVVIERSHRVRSALGLLGVAVLVGTIVAGLITVAIFAISVALRRAVG